MVAYSLLARIAEKLHAFASRPPRRPPPRRPPVDTKQPRRLPPLPPPPPHEEVAQKKLHAITTKLRRAMMAHANIRKNVMIARTSAFAKKTSAVCVAAKVQVLT